MKKQPSEFLTVPLGILGIILVLVVALLGINTLVYAYMEATLPMVESSPTSAFEPISFAAK